MSDFITNGSEFNGQESQDIVLRPIFTGPEIERMGIRVLLSVKSSVKVTFFDAKVKILKAYSDGFQGGSSAFKRQKKFILEEFKAEASYSKQEYADTIQEEITDRGGINQNDIDGTSVHTAEVTVFGRAIRRDTFRIFWLGDTSKKAISNGFKVDKSGDATFDDSGVYSGGGGDDTNYNVIDGIWTAIINSSSVTPSLQPNGANILRIAIDNNTTAQEEVQTLTGSSAGTATLTINSVDYDEAFDTDDETTVTNWVASHAAALALLDVTVVDGLSGDITITSSVSGQPILIAQGASAGGTWTQSGVIANVPAQDLAADEAEGLFISMLTDAPKVLKDKSIRSQIRYYVTDSIEENYQRSLETDGTEQAHTALVDGATRFTFRGIPLLPMEIDEFLSNDFISPFPHRIILTLPTNLVLVLNGASDIGQTRFWFNPDENENRQRSQFEMGADFVLPEFMVVAF